MPTITVYPAAGANDPVDGWVGIGGQNSTFPTIRAVATGNDSNVTNASGTYVYIGASTTSNQFSDLYHGYILFDTSAIPSDAVITSATFSLFGTAKSNGLGSPDIHVGASNPASNSNLVNADFDKISRTSFGSVTYAGWSTSAYNDFTLNASGLSNISKGTGARSKFSVQFSWDINNSFTGAWVSSAASSFSAYTADQGGTGNDPKLVVTYTVIGPANLKSYNTNLKANIKSIDTNLIANIKSINTNA